MPPFNGIVCHHLVGMLEDKTGEDFYHWWQQVQAMMAADPCGCIACMNAEAKEKENPIPRTLREHLIYDRAFRAGQQKVKDQVNRILGPAPKG